MSDGLSVRRISVVAVALAGVAVLLAARPGGGRVASATEGTVYTVTIKNLSKGQPFTPPLLVVHTDGADLFQAGTAASSELQQLAENGNPAPLVALLEASSDVTDIVAGTAPVLPGESVTLQVTAEPGSSLSWVSMLICTNDGFAGLDSVSLVAGSTTVNVLAYDAGTETNTEDFADMVPPCQGLVGVSSSDEGTGMTNPDLAEGGLVALHTGVAGGNDLTASHMWSGSIATVTISEGGPEVSVVSPPSTGDAGLVGSNQGVSTLYILVASFALLALTGASLRAARRI